MAGARGRDKDRSDEVMMQGQAEQPINPMLLLDPILDELKTVVEYHNMFVQRIAGAYTVTVGFRGDAPLAGVLRSSFRTDLPIAEADWLRQRVPLLVEDVLADLPEVQSFHLRLRRQLGEFSNTIGAFLGVPVTVGDGLVGNLILLHGERGHYTPRTVDLVQAFAERRATDLEHAILYADAARLADEAQAVLTVQQAIVRRLEPDAILQKVAEEVLRLTATRRALVLLCQDEVLRLAATAGGSASWLPVGWQTPIDSSLLGKALEKGKPMSFDSLDDQVQAGDAGLLALASRSLLIFPLRSEHQDLGAIVAADKLMGTFGPNDERVVALLASTAVIGLENARVHSQAQRLARMEERQRIAQSLHDTVAQMLFSTGLAIRRVLEEPLLTESARQSLEVARRLSARSSEELRSAIFALSKPELRGGHSLIDLLGEQIQEFRTESGVAAKFVVQAPVAELPHPVGEAVYRIVRESLTNVQKHAQATRVMVHLQWTPDSIVLTIRDDGVGLDTTRSRRVAGQNLQFGVEMMRQLAAEVKGEFAIANNDDGGVTVEARLPIPEGGDA